MKSDAQIIEALNEYLAFELTGHKQYLLHGSLCRHWGFEKLAATQLAYSEEETRHAGEIMARILLLDGVPSMEERRAPVGGQTVREQLENDVRLVSDAIDHLRATIGVCEKARDYVSRDLLGTMLADEELHLDWLETELELIGKVGQENYLQAKL